MGNLLELRTLARFGLPLMLKTQKHGTGRFKRIFPKQSGQKRMKMKGTR